MCCHIHEPSWIEIAPLFPQPQPSTPSIFSHTHWQAVPSPPLNPRKRTYILEKQAQQKDVGLPFVPFPSPKRHDWSLREYSCCVHHVMRVICRATCNSRKPMSRLPAMKTPALCMPDVLDVRTYIHVLIHLGYARCTSVSNSANASTTLSFALSEFPH